MQWAEKDVEDYIAANPWVIGCDRILDRQTAVNGGKIDLVGVRLEQKTGIPVALVVAELKKGVIDCAAVGQLARYVWHLIAGANLTKEANGPGFHGLPLVGVLVGDEADPDAQMLAALCGFEIYSYAPEMVVRCTEIGGRNFGADLTWAGYQDDARAYRSLLKAAGHDGAPVPAAR